MNNKTDLMPHVNWLVARIDEIHFALCPELNGTWQDRALQAVAAARTLAAERGRKTEAAVSAVPKRGRPTNKDKHDHIVSLAICNHTLSMAAIARHVGCSEPLVAKVLRERGAEIADAHREDLRR